jgi:PAS domain S-box-containing protein
MKKDTAKERKFSALRKRAEEILKRKPESIDKMPSENIHKLIHDLNVYQIELEMQNEELRRSQIQLEESRSKYSDLYDFAPVGYFTFDKNGLIIELNLTGALLLGSERNWLVKKPFSQFIHRDDQEKYFVNRQKVLDGESPLPCEIRLVKQGGGELYVRLESVAYQGSEAGVSGIRTAVSDITERKQAERERELIILELREALVKVKTLSTMLPICASCKKIRDDQGFWTQVEDYISTHSETEFSHGICPECAKKLYPLYFDKDELS